MAEISRVLVIGYGVMGRGIAKSFADAGFVSQVLSRRAGQLADIPKGVAVLAALPETPPDLVIESIPEVVATKREAYAAIEAAYQGAPILATNTSGLPLPELESELRYPARFLGTHYFQPADTSAAVEVMACTRTDPLALEATAAAIRKTGKYTFVLKKPITGYLINRLLHAILHESYHLLATGVAPADEIDHAARLIIGPRFCISGMLEQKDIGGLAIHADAQRSIVPALDHTGIPNAHVQDLVKRGETGAGAGLGFYDWRNTDRGAASANANARLKKLLSFLQSLGPRDARIVPQPRPVEPPSDQNATR